MYGLDGKVAIVTGSGRPGGLGEAIVARFAREHCRVVIADLGHSAGEFFPDSGVASSEQMEAVAAAVHERGGEAIAVGCDIRDEEQVRSLVEHTVAAFGALDILVNNAGVGYLMEEITELDRDKWSAVIDVNLTGTFLCTKHAARQMIAQGRGGRIINIASVAGKRGTPFAAAYVASKHGIIGLTRAAALEFGEHGITCNAICPNHVTTGLGAWQNQFFSRLRGMSEDEYLEAMRTRIPLGRTGLPEDTARACAFLASDEAQYITGDALNVSGGEVMH